MKQDNEKQAIKEMVKDFQNAEHWYFDTSTCNSELDRVKTVKNLYAEGYRKQSVGEWVDKPTGAYSRMQSWCSACGKRSGIGGIESNRHKPYCPNCGAKMKGGAE